MNEDNIEIAFLKASASDKNPSAESEERSFSNFSTAGNKADKEPRLTTSENVLIFGEIGETRQFVLKNVSGDSVVYDVHFNNVLLCYVTLKMSEEKTIAVECKEKFGSLPIFIYSWKFDGPSKIGINFIPCVFI